ncbi:hypothetical protein [Actinomadura sp. 9N407]|uniref:hypothetical protein n=1 Tax=Actinomadura sp. 9N407 TaxID=3375154 RepID=UPI0037A644DD
MGCRAGLSTRAEEEAVSGYRKQIKGRELVGGMLELADLHRELGITLTEFKVAKKGVDHIFFRLAARLSMNAPVAGFGRKLKQSARTVEAVERRSGAGCPMFLWGTADGDIRAASRRAAPVEAQAVAAWTRLVRQLEAAEDAYRYKPLKPLGDSSWQGRGQVAAYAKLVPVTQKTQVSTGHYRGVQLEWGRSQE